MLQDCYILLPQAAVNAEKSHILPRFQSFNDSTKRCPFMPFLAIQPSQAIHLGGQCSWLLQSSSPNQRNIGRLHTSFGSKPAQTRPKRSNRRQCCEFSMNVLMYSHAMQLHAASCSFMLNKTARGNPKSQASSVFPTAAT